MYEILGINEHCSVDYSNTTATQEAQGDHLHLIRTVLLVCLFSLSLIYFNIPKPPCICMSRKEEEEEEFVFLNALLPALQAWVGLGKRHLASLPLTHLGN